MSTIEELDQEIKDAEARLAKLRKSKDEYDNLPADKQFGEWLHKKLCHSNHIDQCGWEYENNWQGWTHEEYLKKAQKMLRVTDMETAKEVINISKEL